MARTKSRGRPRANGAPLQWTDDMTLALFQFRADTLSGTLALAPSASNRAVGSRWRAVATRLSEVFGVELDVTQCRNKVKSARKRYAQYVAEHPAGAVASTPEPRVVAIVRQFYGDGQHDDDDDHLHEDDDDDDDENDENDDDGGEEDDAPFNDASMAADTARASGALFAPSLEPVGTASASPFVSPAGSAKKRGRPARNGEGALQWTDALTEKLIHARFDGAARDPESAKRTQRVMWGAIATRLSEETGMRIEPAQCKNKMKVLTARWMQFLKSLRAGSDDREPEPQWASVMRLYCSDDTNGAPPAARAEHREEQHAAVPPSTDEVVIEKEEADALGGDDAGAELDTAGSTSKRRRVAKSKNVRWTDAMTEKLFRLRFETLKGEFVANRNPLHLHHAWEVLAQHLSLEFGSSTELTVDQCKSKIKATKVRWDQYSDALSSGVIPPPSTDPEWVRIIKHYCGGVISDEGESNASEAVEPLAPAPWLDHQRTSEPPVEPPQLSAASPAQVSRRAPALAAAAAITVAAVTNDLPPAAAATLVEAAAPIRLSNGHAKSAAEQVELLESSSADSPVLAQILHAIHEQREAALQQTRVIQELLDFLREERSGRAR